MDTINRLRNLLSVKPFHELLASSVAVHGHLCPGQVIGVRMAILGCRLIELEEPQRLDQIKKLIIYVEMDRCTGDAVAHTTGVKLGRRSLKHMDFGIMAATFLSLETKQAVRIVSTEASRDLTPFYAPDIIKYPDQQIEAYKKMPDSVLFRVQSVDVILSEFDFPGPTRRKVACARCGQVVRDHREVVRDGENLCKICAGQSYFQNAEDISWPEMNWSPDKDKPKSGSFP